VQAVVVVIALLYARHQLSEATRSRELNATTQLLAEIGAPKVREARGYVLYDLVPDFDVSKLRKDEIDLIGSVAVAYDRVGYMIFEELLPPKALFAFHGDDIGLVWNKIKPFVHYTREVADPKRPNYCKRFEQLATDWLRDMERKYGAKKRPPTVQCDKR
jgi:hypothetical protein